MQIQVYGEKPEVFLGGWVALRVGMGLGIIFFDDYTQRFVCWTLTALCASLKVWMLIFHVCCFFFWCESQLMVNCWFGAWWFGFLESPYERDCYLGVPLESKTTNPNQQLTISRERTLVSSLPSRKDWQFGVAFQGSKRQQGRDLGLKDKSHGYVNWPKVGLAALDQG